MARIYSRGDTIWITYSIHGKRFRESLGLRNTRENRQLAKRIKLQKEAEILNGVHPQIRKVKRRMLKESFEEFLKTKENRSDRTIEMYKYCFDKFINHTGDIEFNKIDSFAIKEFEKFIQFSKYGNKENPRRNSKNTIEIIFRHLRIIFEFFRKKNYIKENPFPLKEKTDKKINIISKEETGLILKLLRNQNKDQYRAIRLLFMTGLRIGELIRLQFADIDFKRNLIYIRNSKGRRIDTLPLYWELREFILANWKESERKGKVVRYNRVDSLRFFRHLLKKNNIRHYTLHEIRKTFLTRLANSGISLFDLQQIARHKDIKTTQKYYLEAEIHRIGDEINNVIKDTINDTALEKNLKIA